MSKKTVIAVAVSALVCGLWVSNASAKHRHHPMHMAAPKAEAMKAVPGNNPLTIAANSSTKMKYDAPKSVPGNNPMAVAKPK